MGKWQQGDRDCIRDLFFKQLLQFTVVSIRMELLATYIVFLFGDIYLFTVVPLFLLFPQNICLISRYPKQYF